MVAKKRVKRGGDAYEVLDSALWAVEHAPLEAERFVDFRAADALQYLADEAGKSEDLAQKVLCLRDGAPSADGLALLVASLVAAGAARLPSGDACCFLDDKNSVLRLFVQLTTRRWISPEVANNSVIHYILSGHPTLDRLPGI